MKMKRVEVSVVIDVQEDEYSSSEHLRCAESMVEDAVRHLPGFVSAEWIGCEDALAQPAQGGDDEEWAPGKTVTIRNALLVSDTPEMYQAKGGEGA